MCYWKKKKKLENVHNMYLHLLNSFIWIETRDVIKQNEFEVGQIQLSLFYLTEHN